MENIYFVCLPMLFLSANGQYSLFTSAHFANRDQEFLLTCSLSNSETSAVMTWTRNGVSVVNIKISDCFEGDTGQRLYNLYRYNCTVSSRRYNLIIPTPRINSEADSRWYCGSSGGGSNSNNFTLQLYTLGQNARIIVVDQFVLKTDMIKIQCQPAGSLFIQINALSILKNNQPMVSVRKLNGESSISWHDFRVQRRATTNTPNLDNVSTAQLRVTIEADNTQCDDQAMYTCNVNGFDSNFITIPYNEASANVSAVVKPDRIHKMTIYPLPSTAGHYSEGQIITFSCTGTVGAYNYPLRIAWCLQRNVDFSPSELESDRYLRSITQSKVQAVGSGPETSCQFERTSKMVYEVANIDTNTTIWCQITAPGDNPICGQGTVRQQNSISVGQTTKSPGLRYPIDEDETNNGVFIGAIIGGVASIILAITLVAVIIKNIFYGRKAPKTRNIESNEHTENKNIYNTLDISSALSDVRTYNVINDIERTYLSKKRRSI